VRRAVVRSTALPSEHGAWSFLLEPILLGLGVAFSWPGLLVAAAAVGAFLLHQPLKTAVKDARAGRRAPRTRWARRFAALYGVATAGALAGAVATGAAGGLAVLGAAAPLAAVQLLLDARNRSRALAAEVCGAAALAAVAPAIAVVDGWAAGPAWGLWLVLVARAVPSILYVRTRLALERHRPAPRAAALGAHALAALAVGAGAAAGLAPWLAAAAMLGLVARAAHGLSRARLGHTPAAVGLQELAAGLATVLLTIAGSART
jgi:hypothetical protein